MSETPPRAPDEAIQVLQKFLDASLKLDVPTMRTCLSASTLASGNFNSAGQEGVRYQLGESIMEGKNALVPVRTFPIDAPPDSPPASILPAILVLEDGTWKFDLAATMERLMGGVGGAMQTAMNQFAETLGQAVEGIGQVMSQAFGDSPGTSRINWRQTPVPDYAPEELLPLPEMAAFPKLSAALSSICRHPVSAGCAIKDLLYQLNSEERQTLIDWFDNELFEGWVSAFALIAQRLPIVRRLQGFRVEAAKHTDQRMLILDGSDLVYRVWLNTKEGYYSDEFALSLLPGILAALPENPDPQVTGHRLIHTDEEVADLELFKSHAVPRTMHKICELLGKNIELQADWDDIFNPREDTRQLYRWTLNRILGAIALTCQNPRTKEKLAAELSTIKLLWASSTEDREANLTGGILTIAICYFREEQGCFYERDLAGVLAGQPIAKIIVSDPPEEATSDDDSKENEEDQDDADKEVVAANEPEEPKLTPEQAAQALNDENFRSAAASLKQNEPIWATQLELVLKHPTTLTLDFDSLGGRYDLVQPFIHQALSGALEAITKIAFDPRCSALAQSIDAVIIRRGDIGQVALEASALTVAVPLQSGDAAPPSAEIFRQLMSLAGIKTEAPAQTSTAPAPNPARLTKEQKKAAKLYKPAAEFAVKLEATLRENNMWPGEKPPGEIEVRGAFGSQNMAFTQWLAWILIPRINDIIASQGSFPSESNLGTYAIREFDGEPAGPEIAAVLSQFDHLINRH